MKDGSLQELYYIFILIIRKHDNLNSTQSYQLFTGHEFNSIFGFVF